MKERQPLDAFAISVMLVLCVLWGLQQVAVKLAAPAMHPIAQTGWRAGVAALLVYALTRLRGQRLSLCDGTLVPGIAAGALFALEFLCVAIGLQYSTASHISVFQYTAPIFTVLGLHMLVPGEKLGPRQWTGVLAAFVGVAIAFSEGFSADAQELGDMLLGDALAVIGAIFWAATTVVIRYSRLSEAAPAQTLLYQLGACAVIMLTIAACTGNLDATMTPVAWGSLFFQAVIVAFISYLIWFWMLRKYLASRLSVFSFLTPLFGVGFGVLILNDPLDTRFVIGAALVMLGVVMVNRSR